MRKILPLLLAACVSATATAVAAPADVVSEMRFGLLRHDAGIFGNHKEPGLDVNGELLFIAPDLFEAIGAPRPQLGVTVNTAGQTSQAYAGLAWTWDFAPSFFAEASLGAAIHDGNLDKSDPARKALGSRVEFRESVSLGWRIDDAVSLSLFLDHISNAGLARYNGGMDGIGIRIGYRF